MSCSVKEGTRDFSWEGRAWLSVDHALFMRHENIDNDIDIDMNIIEESNDMEKKSLRVLSYHLLSNYKCQLLNYSSMKDSSHFRNHQLFREIRSYDADILFLQDIDHYQAFWFDNLYILGYESVFCQRTHVRDTYYEGVVIAYRRHLFRLVKSSPVHFNNAADQYYERGQAFKERCITDDVGLLLMLESTMSAPFLPKSVCLGCAMFTDDDNGEAIRQLQSIYFTKEIALFNKDILAPVILGVDLQDNPSSPSYHIFRTGRIPIRGDVPNRCPQPRAIPISRGSIKLYWKLPPMTEADPPIKSFRISWRPGGSLLIGFDSQITLLYEDCLDYDGDKLSIDHHANSTTLSHIITGLSSTIAYEFRVAAINYMGEGLWSEISEPVQMRVPKLDSNKDLVLLRPIHEVAQIREQLAMNSMDINANVSSLIPLILLQNLSLIYLPLIFRKRLSRML
jgi:hypothetical protein